MPTAVVELRTFSSSVPILSVAARPNTSRPRNSSGIEGNCQDRLPAQRRAARTSLRGRGNQLSTRPKGHTALCEVLDHRRRKRLHYRLQVETTADRLFSDEQFEAYRALGFHAVSEVFSGGDYVGMRPNAAQWQGPVLENPLVKAAKDLLKWG